MLDRVGLTPGEALAAGEVVEERGVLRVRRGQVPSPVGRFVVPSLLVEPPDRGPELPAGRRVDLPRRGPRRENRRPRLLGERRPLHARAGEDERAGRRIHAFAVEFEPGSAAVDEVELLILPLLIVLVDDPVSGLPTRPGVDPERRDAKVVAQRTPRLAAVGDLVDVLQARDCVLAHRYPSGLFAAGRPDRLTRASCLVHGRRPRDPDRIDQIVQEPDWTARRAATKVLPSRAFSVTWRQGSATVTE